MPSVPSTVTSHASRLADAGDSLQLLLLIAYLQSELYTRASAVAEFVPATDRPVFDRLRDQESLHIETLAALLTARGADPVARPVFDFTGKGAVPGFAFAADQYETFRMLAQAFEDLGVRAYKGQVPELLADATILTYALAIHAVEARHASEVRRLRGTTPWITDDAAAGLPAFAQAIYAGEEVSTQGAVNVTSAMGSAGVAAAAQAFDEPLTMAQVTAILTPFIA